MGQVAEPVRFVIETKARILPQNERYWYYAKKSLVKQFNVRVERQAENQELFDVIGIDKSEEIELNRSKMNLTMQLANLTASTWSSLKSPPQVRLFIKVIFYTLPFARKMSVVLNRPPSQIDQLLKID